MVIDRPPRGSPRAARRGFSLIELMATLAVFAVVITLAAPSMSELLRNQRVKTASFDLFSSLMYARSEAIKRNANISVTPNGGDWGTGWSISDPNGNVLKSQSALAEVTVSGGGTVTYTREGRVSGVAGMTLMVQSSASSTVKARCIQIDLSGRPNIKVGATGGSC